MLARLGRVRRMTIWAAGFPRIYIGSTPPVPRVGRSLWANQYQQMALGAYEGEAPFWWSLVLLAFTRVQAGCSGVDIT